MMVAAFFLGLAVVVVGIYWLIGRDINHVPKHKDPGEDGSTAGPDGTTSSLGGATAAGGVGGSLVSPANTPIPAAATIPD